MARGRQGTPCVTRYCLLGGRKSQVLEASPFSNTFHSFTDSGRIPRIPAGIQELRGIPGIPEDSGRNTQESDWNRQKITVFMLYLSLYLHSIFLFYFIYISWNRGVDRNCIIFQDLTKSSCGTKSLFLICIVC